jgi:hypothetical protein
MKRILSICLLFSVVLTNTILVPEQYNTIQLGVDASVDGDTVLVNQGVYYENIHLTKSIVLASYAVYDNLDNWTEYDAVNSEWQIINDNINNTIINGSTAADDYGSCILIYSQSNDCITPEVIGFTLSDGLGTQVTRLPQTEDEEEVQQRLGGGILYNISDPTIKYNKFIDNGSDEVAAGGGTYGTTSEEDWSFNNRELNNRSRCDITEFKLTNNLYNGNDALFGNTLSSRYSEDTFDMSGSVFDVANINTEEISSVWVYLESTAEVNLENISSNSIPITGNSAYINPNIN